MTVVAILFLTKCAKDDTLNPDGAGSAEYLISEVWINGMLQHTRTYDDHRRLETITMYEGEKVFATSKNVYNEQGLLAEVVSEGTVARYEYDNKGILLNVISYVNGELGATYAYTYSRQKLTITMTGAEGGELIQIHSYDEDGNMRELYTATGIYWNKTVFDDFDDKKVFDTFSPFYLISPSSHNPRYIKYTDSQGGTNERLYEYKYNQAGYVIEYKVIDKTTSETIEQGEYKLIKKS